MRQEAHKRKWMLPLLAALLLVVMLAGMVFALSANVQEVLDRLQMLQAADVDPAWLPDIEKNESAVQALLDSYLRCTTAESKEFTARQNSDLRAYFEALYEVQGKDPADVDKIFAGTVPAPSSSATASVSAGASAASGAASSSVSSAPSSSQSASSAAISSSSAAGAAVAGTSGAASSRAPVQQVFFSPQIPQGGWVTFFGNGAMGAVVMVVLAVLIVLVFVRFLAAVRSAGKATRETWVEEFRNRELFGENYGQNAVAQSELPAGPAALPKKAERQKHNRRKQQAQDLPAAADVPPAQGVANPWMAVAPAVKVAVPEEDRRDAATTDALDVLEPAPDTANPWMGIAPAGARPAPAAAPVRARRTKKTDAAPKAEVPVASQPTPGLAEPQPRGVQNGPGFGAGQMASVAARASTPTEAEQPLPQGIAPISAPGAQAVPPATAAGQQGMGSLPPEGEAPQPKQRAMTAAQKARQKLMDELAGGDAYSPVAFQAFGAAPVPERRAQQPVAAASQAQQGPTQAAETQQAHEPESDAAPVKARVNPNRPRTGRPGKMKFQPGDADDIDAIDE